jgi:hypothetical protein
MTKGGQEGASRGTSGGASGGATKKHPASNGFAERAVQTAKSVLKKLVVDGNGSNFELKKKLIEFLYNYRNSIHTVENIVPSHKILNFNPKTELDFLKIEKRSIFKRKSIHVYMIHVNSLIKFAHVNQLKKSILKSNEITTKTVTKELTKDKLRNEMPRRSTRNERNQNGLGINCNTL